jgi:hypothetical protein
MRRALALGGCPFDGRHNNQPRVGFCNRLEVGEEARWAGSVWGHVIPSFRALNGATTTKNTSDIRWLPINDAAHNNQPKTRGHNKMDK